MEGYPEPGGVLASPMRISRDRANSLRGKAGLPFTFTTKSRDAGRFSAALGVGAAWRPTERASARVDYDLTVGKRYTAHGVGAMIGIAF